MKRFFIPILLVLTCSLFSQTKPDALKLYSAGQYVQSIEVCKAEIKDNPKNIESYVVLSWSLVKNKQYREAEYWAAEGRKISAYDHRIIEILAEAKYYLGNNTDALSLFQEYVSVVPNGSRIGDVYYFMGEIFIRLAKFQHADIALTSAVRYEPLHDLWWARLGYAREMARSYTSSRIAYEKALSLNSVSLDAQRGHERVMKIINR